MGLYGPGGRRMANVDWAGVCAILSIITLLTVIGYREGHSTLDLSPLLVHGFLFYSSGPDSASWYSSLTAVPSASVK